MFLYGGVKVISNERKEPDRIVRTGGCEFHLYKYYDDSLGEELINYPDFQENPEYTSDGRPFVLTIQECCPMGKSNDPKNPNPGDCSGCVWLCLEAPADAIGVCMCDALQREQNKEK